MAELKETLDEKRKLVDQKATQYRTTRDDWNARTKEHTTIRNELNAEVRELIQNVRQQREIREQMNELVREKKSIRSEANKKVKQAKAMLDSERSDKNEAPAAGHRGPRSAYPGLEQSSKATLVLEGHMEANRAETRGQSKR